MMSKEDMRVFFQTKQQFPVCTSSPDISDENLGWTAGVLVDGVPFVAELWQIADEQSITVIIPLQESLLPNWQGVVIAVEDATYPEEDVLESKEGDFTVRSASALTDKMGILDDFTTQEQLVAHVNYLCNMGVIAFTDIYENGGIQVLKDLSGHPVVAIHISLTMDGITVAHTSLEFQSFRQRAC